MDIDLPNGSYILGIRPHHIEVVENGSHTEGIKIDATVELAEIVGSETTLHLAHKDLNFIALSQSFADYDLDQEIVVSLNPRQIHIFDAETNQIVSNAAEVR
jgi:ABC-type sugar transport system ATPase subunit